MSATIKDIAQKTGLGLATISSYLNGGNVREYNRIKIEQAIEELHFEVNEVARGLKTNSTRTIGVVIPQLDNVFFTGIISKCASILREHGYATIVCDCESTPEKEEEVISFFMKKRVDGIIISPIFSKNQLIRKFAEKKPVIVIDRKMPDTGCSSVLVNNRKAVEEAVTLLIEKGHTKIGFIGGPDSLYTARERLAGYQKIMEKYNYFQDSYVEKTDYTIEGGRKGAELLLKRHPELTAMLLSNYETTVGSLIAVNEAGLTIPDNLSVIGYDNIDFARAYYPKLSIIMQPTEQIAVETATCMLNLLKEFRDTEEEQERIHIELQAELISGASVSQI